MKPNSAEQHIFLLWENARSKENEIIDDIFKNFLVQKVFVVAWSKENFSNNLSRFYGQNLPSNCHKELHVGTGPFLVIIVEDPNPIFEERETSHGLDTVNVNMFEKKQLYRSWTGGGHKIHATDNTFEANHNSTLLFGKNVDDLLSEFNEKQSREISSINGDCVGCCGWNSIEQLFYVLNNTCNYIVMRNFECLPDQYTMAEHGDIDLLTDNPESLKYILNANPVFPQDYRVLHNVGVAGEIVQFDIRNVNENYYQKKWAHHLLERKVLSTKNYFRPNPRDYYYSLLYHALVHKPEIALDYKIRLPNIAKDANVSLNPKNLDSPFKLNQELGDYMSQNGYEYTEPKDLSVYFNLENTPLERISVERIVSLNLSGPKTIAKILSQAKDRSSNSSEFKFLKFSNEVEFRKQFTPYRGLPIDIWDCPSSTKVLEIGTGLGPVTRYLGENFNTVTSIGIEEEKLITAQIRCEDLKNVNIVDLQKGLEGVESNHDLAVIILSFGFLSGQNSGLIELQNRLDIAKSLTHEEGDLILAVENKHGIKNTLLEDKFWGLDKLEIERILIKNGYIDFEFAYAFPDHFLCQTFLSQKGADSNIKSLEHWINSVAFMDKKGVSIPAEQSIAALQLANQKGMLGELANSFVIYASRKKINRKINWYVKGYNGEQRIKDAWTETTLLELDNEKVVVKSGKNFEKFPFCFKPNESNPLYEGESLETIFLYLVKSKNQKKFFDYLNMYAQFLLDNYQSNTNQVGPCGRSDVLLRGESFDVVGKNIIVNSDGWFEFDKEWQTTIPLPLSFLCFRILLMLNSRVENNELIGSLNIQELGHVTNDIKDSYVVILNQISHLKDVSREILQNYFDFHQTFAEFTYDENYEAGIAVDNFISLCGSFANEQHPDATSSNQRTKKTTY